MRSFPSIPIEDLAGAAGAPQVSPVSLPPLQAACSWAGDTFLPVESSRVTRFLSKVEQVRASRPSPCVSLSCRVPTWQKFTIMLKPGSQDAACRQVWAACLEPSARKKEKKNLFSATEICYHNIATLLLTDRDDKVEILIIFPTLQVSAPLTIFLNSNITIMIY